MANLEIKEVNLNVGSSEKTLMVYYTMTEGARYDDNIYNFDGGSSRYWKNVTSDYTPTGSEITVESVSKIPVSGVAVGTVYKADSNYYQFVNRSSEISQSTIEVNPVYNSDNTVLLYATATVTLSTKLKAKYPQAVVTIDGKDYNMAVLDNSLNFYMNQDHKISILWSGKIREAFQIVAKK